MLVRILIPVFIVILGFGAWKFLGVKEEPPVSRERPPQRLKTERLILSRTDFPVLLESQGTVRAHHSTTLTSQVEGTIASISPSFEDGAFFDEGEILAELDPFDLEAELIASESRLAQAEAALAQEEARAKQAALNWEDIGYTEAPSPLVLRVPQLKEANANVTAARANVDQATRNLERAKIRAPFAGRVRTRLVGPGQAVGGTTSLGEIFATGIAEVRLPLSAGQLAFVRLPTREDDAPVPVTLTDALGNPDVASVHSWKARIVRTEGALDEASRELFAIARIEDPFGLQSGNPELRIGQPVRASIDGIVLKDIFVLPRTALRGVNRVYLIDKETITIQRTTIEPIWSTTDVLVVRDGLQAGDWLATSRLPYAPNDAPAEIIDPPPAAAADQAETQVGTPTSGS